MIRATLAVFVLLASIFVLSQNLIDSSTETTPAEPLRIEIPVDGEQLPSRQIDHTTAVSVGVIELVDHQQAIEQPGVHLLAQRWGGRSNLRSRIRRSLRPPTVDSTRPWQTREDEKEPPVTAGPTPANPATTPDNPDNLPMAELGKPIPAPSAVPEARKPVRRTQRPTAKQRRTIPQKAREPRLLPKYNDDGFDSVGIVDPADGSPAPTRRPTPSRSPAVKSQQTDAPTQLDQQQPTAGPAETATPQTVDSQPPLRTEQPKSRYFDNDWYQPTAQLSKAMAARKRRIAQTLDHYYRRPLNSSDHSPWSLMHTMIAWGSDSYIRAGGAKGRSVGTVHWLANNGLSDGVRLLYIKDGKLRARTGPGLQGHDGQFLAMLAQTRVRVSYPLRVDGRTFTVRDLIELEKKTCRSDMELTFKLIGLSHYLAPDESWRSETGTRWSIPKLINAEIAAPINGVTCGGTHRLMGLNYAVRMRRRAGFPVDGEWARAEKYTADYVQLALRQQNDDGSFSSNFFRGPGSWGDNERKLKTSGHLLEYVVFSVPHEALRDRRITNAVDYLTSMLMQDRYYDWPKGPIGHAIRALSLYNERMFNIPPGHRRAAQMAKRRQQETATKK